MVNQREDVELVGEILTEDYYLRIEKVEGNMFCHLDIYQWSVAVYKSMLVDLESIREAVAPSILLCNMNKDEPEKIKLVEMFGFLTAHDTGPSYVMELV